MGNPLRSDIFSKATAATLNDHTVRTVRITTRTTYNIPSNTVPSFAPALLCSALAVRDTAVRPNRILPNICSARQHN